MSNRATPMLSYEDVGSAIDWLGNAFGFEESGERFTVTLDDILP